MASGQVCLGDSRQKGEARRENSRLVTVGREQSRWAVHPPLIWTFFLESFSGRWLLMFQGDCGPGFSHLPKKGHAHGGPQGHTHGSHLRILSR